jgi:hypothetical protein
MPSGEDCHPCRFRKDPRCGGNAEGPAAASRPSLAAQAEAVAAVLKYLFGRLTIAQVQHISYDALTAAHETLRRVPEVMEALKVTLDHDALFNRDSNDIWVSVRDNARAALRRLDGAVE